MDNIEKKEEKPINLPNPDYKQPYIITSKRANKKVASHLLFLKKFIKK